MSSLDERAKQHAERKAADASAQQAQEDGRLAQEARKAELLAVGQSEEFRAVREILDDLMIRAVEGCLHGREAERDKAQGAFQVIADVLAPFGFGVFHGIGQVAQAQTRQPGLEEAG